MKPSNYVYISQSKGALRGEWLLDPTLSIPSQYLAPLLPDQPDEASRRNMYLHCNGGPISAKIRLESYKWPSMGDGGLNVNGKRSTIYAETSKGPVRVQLYDNCLTADDRHAVYLNINAPNSPVSLYLPRTFSGLLTVKARQSKIEFSSEVLAKRTTFHDVDMSLTCFIGDCSKIAQLAPTEQWKGDEVVVEAEKGSLWVGYADAVQAIDLGHAQNLTGFPSIMRRGKKVPSRSAECQTQ